MNNASLELGGTNWAEKDASLLGYSVGDTSGKYFPQEFTFARGSNLSATRIGKTGLIEKGRENVLLQSNSFDTTWVVSDAIASPGYSGYDGNTNAWFLDKIGGDGRVKQDKTLNGIQTFSVYAKAATNNWVGLVIGGPSATYSQYFDVLNGVIGSPNPNPSWQNIDSKIEWAGNGWWRCSVTITAQASTYLIYVADSDRVASGGSGAILIQDAQVETALVATPYIGTTTTTAQAGVLENTPRLNYTTGVANPYLLLEPSRTNLIPYSEYFGAWDGGLLSVDSDFYDSPEGVSNANFLIPTTASGIHKLREDLSSVTGLYTQSVYAKQGGYKNLLVWNDSTSGGIGVNLDDLSIFRNANNSGYNVEEVGNGWVRISVTHNFSAQLMLPSLYIYDNSATPAISYAGDGTSGVYIYGASLEEGSYATSYIPTYSVSATRARDAINQQITNLTSVQEGTFFLDFDRGLTNGTARDGNSDGFFYRSGSSFPATNAIEIATDVDGKVRVLLRTPSGVNILYQNNIISQYKMLAKWSNSEIELFVNGSSVYNSSVKWGDVTSPLEYIGYNSSFRKNVHQLLTYSTALTDADCITLTTL